jgi:uncharacterized protein
VQNDNRDIPFSYFVLKIASRCNLNCSYCYMYNLADQTWKQQPAFMSPAVITAIAEKVRAHAVKHGLKELSFSLHGGEPLLGGITYVREIVKTLRTEIQEKAGLRLGFCLQTNGTLLTTDWINALADLDVKVGLSMDGPQRAHDRYRVDHGGLGSYSHVKKAADLLAHTEKGNQILGSVLCVINLENSPVDIYDHFIELGLLNMDFLLPDCNYVYFPPGKRDFHHTPYADWLIQLFDKWYEMDDRRVSIRLFESMLLALLGQGTGLDSIGSDPLGLAIIETDGSIEPLDVLKCTEAGLTKLGINILYNQIDDLQRFDFIQLQTRQAGSLCAACESCKYRAPCGGGYLPHRYSGNGVFLNPSIYCADLFRLFAHIERRIGATKSVLAKTQLRSVDRGCSMPEAPNWQIAL